MRLVAEPKDFIKEVEAAIQRSAEWAAQLMEKSVDRIAPRAVGSEKVSPQDALDEYVLTVARAPDPELALQQRYDAWAGQYGHPVARTMVVRYVQDNERKMREMVEKNGNPPALPPV